MNPWHFGERKEIKMSEHDNFKQDCLNEIDAQGADKEFKALTNEWVEKSAAHKYSYHFEWLGRPVIQYPQDIVGMQQLIWNIKPDLIIETGIARGGSLILSASILELVAACGGNPDAKVLGVDIDIRDHNRQAVEDHPMSKRIEMIQGSSVAPDIITQVKDFAKDYKTILVCLDSNHTHDHVLEELKLYAPLASVGSYCIAFDTIVEDMDKSLSDNRPWGPGDNPKTAVWEYLDSLKSGDVKDDDGNAVRYEIDKVIENQLMITVAPDGFLKRV